jgi:hypothetical protein
VIRIRDRFRIMDRKPPSKTESDCSQKIKKLGWELFACSVFVLLAGLISIGNLGNEGEIGQFAHGMVPAFLCVVAWALATGIGLLRSWRWARISMLVVSSFPIALGILIAVGLLLLPKGEISGLYLLGLKSLAVALDFIPIAIGIRWFNYFRRDNVKAYFRT